MAKRILIIDDSDHLRFILKMTLQFKNFNVLEAENGQIGLQIASAQPCDLILCDIDMPVMNGLEFVKRYRAGQGAVPVLMLTAEGSDLTTKALAAGATAIIHKPFEPIALMGELEKYLV